MKSAASACSSLRQHRREPRWLRTAACSRATWRPRLSSAFATTRWRSFRPLPGTATAWRRWAALPPRQRLLLPLPDLYHSCSPTLTAQRRVRRPETCIQIDAPWQELRVRDASHAPIILSAIFVRIRDARPDSQELEAAVGAFALDAVEGRTSRGAEGSDSQDQADRERGLHTVHCQRESPHKAPPEHNSAEGEAEAEAETRCHSLLFPGSLAALFPAATRRSAARPAEGFALRPPTRLEF